VLAVYVMDRLKAGWSPEQIAGRLRASGAPERLSHETIYRFVYGTQRQPLGLYQDRPMARRRRRARDQRKPRGLVLPAGSTIEQRPAEIAARTSFGHWEGDPQAPWQKGTVENTHGRVRRFLSRGADIAALPEQALLGICDRLNGTPRKCLGYRTPKEVLMSSLDPGLPGLCNPDQLRPGSP
jgi:IS30 family transposase